MIRIYALISVVALITSCENTESKVAPARTTISGTMEGGAGKSLYVNSIDKRQRGKIFDTIAIAEDGTFNHEIKKPLKLDYYVITNSNRNQVFLITDSTENITLNASYNGLNKPTSIEGSPHTQVYLDLKEMISSHYEEVREVEKKIAAEKSIDQKIRVGKEKKVLKEEFSTELSSFLEKHKNSPGIAAFFDSMDFTTEMDIANTAINHLAKLVPNSNYYKAREKNIKDYNNMIRKSTASSDKGKVAPNIELDDPDGVEKTLYELRGKVVLIDFWASWCGPCRRENPNVVKAYNKYHDAGFEVFSVSLDNNRDKWVAAIEQDGLIWDYHVSDLKKWDTPYKSIYKFSGIPHTVLVDREGKIVDTKVRGAALENKLEDLFGF